MILQNHARLSTCLPVDIFAWRPTLITFTCNQLSLGSYEVSKPLTQPAVMFAKLGFVTWSITMYVSSSMQSNLDDLTSSLSLTMAWLHTHADVHLINKLKACILQCNQQWVFLRTLFRMHVNKGLQSVHIKQINYKHGKSSNKPNCHLGSQINVICICVVSFSLVE